MSSVFKLLTTFLLLWSLISSSMVMLSSAMLINPSAGFRSILRAIEGGRNQPDFAVDLNVTSFDAAFKDTTATYAIVEFFAHWCPACRNYKPHYEKVAKLFNGANAVHPGIILMTRVDCANEINTKLCDEFSVGHYPSLYWGPPSKFVGGGWDGTNEKSEIRPINDGRTADRLLKWINTQLGSSYDLEDEKNETDHLLHSNVSDSVQITHALYDVEEATSVAFDIILQHKMIKPDTRATLVKFMHLMASHHPSKGCRTGSADILANFDDLYPSIKLLTNKHKSENNTKHGFSGKFGICGKEFPRGYWTFCRGSKNDTRGFSCGLWVLLHSLSVRVKDGESQMAFTTTCDFIQRFFICEECRQHFHNMCSRVSTPFTSTREFVLWLWSAHNEVNKRLKNTEESFKTRFPKTIWPTKQLCPTCYNNLNQNKESSSIDWDRVEVFKFICNYYGNMLAPVYNETDKEQIQIIKNAVSEQVLKSTNSLVGAALAIALVSCLFGAVACFWRSWQKNRKYFHKPQPLKIV